MYLRYLVIGEISPTRFLETGQRQVDDLIRPLLDRHGRRVEDFHSVLDFGCGCGRILRHWKGRVQGRVTGVDINARLVRWCQGHLPFAEVTTSDPAPPLDFADESFDFAYARSVFTHLDEELGSAWIAELRRVLEPGGLLLFTVSGDQFTDVMEAEELKVYRAGHLVVRNTELIGMNQCAAFHPQ